LYFNLILLVKYFQVNLIAGEQVAIFYDDAGWAVVRRTHTNNSFGAVPLQYLEIWSKAQE
jgi:hypothetical protein